MSLPTTLGNISTSNNAWGSDFEYRHKSSITGYEIYDLWKISHSNWFNVAAGFPNPDAYSIKVDTSTGVWSDNAPTTTPLVDASNSTYVILSTSSGDEKYRFTKPSYFASGPTVTYGPSHGALPTSSGFSVYNLNFTKVGDREYKISYQQKNAPPNSYTVRVGVYSPSLNASQNIDYTVTTAATNQTINLRSGSLYGTGPMAAASTPQNGDYIQIRFMDFDAKLGSAGTTISQGHILQQWQYLYNNLTATFTPSSGVPGTVFNFTLTGSDDNYASSNTATLTDPSGTVTTFTKNTDGQFHDSVTNVTSIEGDYTVEHPTGVNRGTSTYDNSGPPTVVNTNGGRKRRYPIISTNLFDRQRSIYSIGNTHKDETLF